MKVTITKLSRREDPEHKGYPMIHVGRIIEGEFKLPSQSLLDYVYNDIEMNGAAEYIIPDKITPKIGVIIFVGELPIGMATSKVVDFYTYKESNPTTELFDIESLSMKEGDVVIKTLNSFYLIKEVV